MLACFLSSLGCKGYRGRMLDFTIRRAEGPITEGRPEGPENQFLGKREREMVSTVLKSTNLQSAHFSLAAATA